MTRSDDFTLIALCFGLYMYITEGDGTMLFLEIIFLIFRFIFPEKKILPKEGKIVVISGCDTGIGNLLAKHLDTKGVTVFAGCLNVDGEGAQTLKKEGSDKLQVIQMDVTNDHQVAAVKNAVMLHMEDTGESFWGVVNNAGLNFHGEAELCTMRMYERVYEINSLGMVRTTLMFLPLIRESKGRIVNISSMKGLLVTPTCAAYNMSKFAGEAFSDTLRLEVKKWGIKVCIIEPGNFGGATGCTDMERLQKDFSQMWEATDENLKTTYGKQFIDDQLAAIERSKSTACFDLYRITNAIEDALFAQAPKARYLIGGASGWYDIHKILITLSPFLPSSVMDNLQLRFLNLGSIKPDLLQRQ